MPVMARSGRTPGPQPTRRRGLAFMALGALYIGAMVPFSFALASGWLGWAVLVSSVATGGMVFVLGAYLFRLAPAPPA
jgi:hypothetical protein